MEATARSPFSLGAQLTRSHLPVPVGHTTQLSQEEPVKG